MRTQRMSGRWDCVVYSILHLERMLPRCAGGEEMVWVITGTWDRAPSTLVWCSATSWSALFSRLASFVLPRANVQSDLSGLRHVISMAAFALILHYNLTNLSMMHRRVPTSTSVAWRAWCLAFKTCWRLWLPTRALTTISGPRTWSTLTSGTWRCTRELIVLFLC